MAAPVVTLVAPRRNCLRLTFMAFGGMVKGRAVAAGESAELVPRAPTKLLLVRTTTELSVRTNILRSRANQVRRFGDFCKSSQLSATIVVATVATTTGCWTDIAYDASAEVAEADQPATAPMDPPVASVQVETDAGETSSFEPQGEESSTVEPPRGLDEGFGQDAPPADDSFAAEPPTAENPTAEKPVGENPTPEDSTAESPAAEPSMPDDDELAAESFGAELAAVESIKPDSTDGEAADPQPAPLETPDNDFNLFGDVPAPTPPEATPTAEPATTGDRYADVPRAIEDNGIDAAESNAVEWDTAELNTAAADEMAGLAESGVTESLEDEPSGATDSLDWLTGSTDRSLPDEGALEAELPPTGEVPTVEPIAELPLAELDPESPSVAESVLPENKASAEQSPAELAPLPWETPTVEETSPATEQPSTSSPVAELLPVPTDSVEADSSDATVADAAPAAAIDPSNTQLLTWRVAKKLSSALGDPRQNLGDVLGELTGPARVLQIDLDALPIAPNLNGKVSPKQWLAIGRQLGEQVAKEHGSQHAALTEVAFKSELLLSLITSRPQLKDTISESVVAAAKRAELPEGVWRSWQQNVAFSSDAAGVEQAVRQLHKAVDQHFDEGRSLRREESSPVLR